MTKMNQIPSTPPRFSQAHEQANDDDIYSGI